MNADRLLCHFEKISDAPDAVDRLRRFILDLAVRGKLVEQDAGDEPCPSAAVVAQIPDAPFPVPASWRWIAFGGVHDLVRGVTYTKSDVGDSADEQHIAVLRANNIGARLNLDDLVYVRRRCVSNEQMLRQGDFLIALSSGSKNLVGKAASVEEPVDAAFGGFCGVVRLNDQDLRPYVRMYLSSPLYREAIAAGSRGIGINNLKRATLDALPFPLPPLAEQHRIVEKVDELMTLCDRLESSQKERESRRDRLVVASLNRLSQTTDPDEFKKDPRFPLSNLSRLSTKPEHIKELRKAILNLAVRGKLVPQDETEGTAAEVLHAVAKERQDLIDRGAVRREKPVAPIAASEIPFSIPGTWEWSRIANVVLFTQYGTSRKGMAGKSGVPVLAMGNIQDGKVLLGKAKTVPATSEELPGLYLRHYDLLYNRTNSAELVGKTGLFIGEDDRYTFASYLIRLRPSLTATAPSFLNCVMSSPAFRETQIVPHIKKQTGQANVNGTALRNMLVPLPPLAEQKRIVAKVDELMLICDQLEHQLESQQKCRRQLLEALLHEALEGVG